MQLVVHLLVAELCLFVSDPNSLSVRAQKHAVVSTIPPSLFTDPIHLQRDSGTRIDRTDPPEDAVASIPLCALRTHIVNPQP